MWCRPMCSDSRSDMQRRVQRPRISAAFVMCCNHQIPYSFIDSKCFFIIITNIVHLQRFLGTIRHLTINSRGPIARDCGTRFRRTSHERYIQMLFIVSGVGRGVLSYQCKYRTTAPDFECDYNINVETESENKGFVIKVCIDFLYGILSYVDKIGVFSVEYNEEIYRRLPYGYN